MEILRTTSGHILRTAAGHILRTPIPPDGPVIFYPEYGLLYNWYAATDSRKITSSDDWVVPTTNQIRALADELGALANYTSNSSGGKMKETGTAYWDSPNTGADNSSGFNGRGIGYRTETGTFSGVNLYMIQWASDQYNSTSGYSGTLRHNTTTFSAASNTIKKFGNAIRLIYTGAGTPTTYTGNDGKIYRTVKIGTQYWLADNLAETRFRNGDIIPWYGASAANYFTNAEWAALTTAGCCAYNNTLSNVATGFIFPT